MPRKEHCSPGIYRHFALSSSLLFFHRYCRECIIALPELNLSRMKLDIIQAFPRMELVLTLKKKNTCGALKSFNFSRRGGGGEGRGENK